MQSKLSDSVKIIWLDREVVLKTLHQDVFSYTREEFELMLKEGNRLVKSALAEGIDLFPRKGQGE